MNNSNLSIKSIVVKQLMESTEPFFYLAPHVVGSINNAYPIKNRKLFVVDFNTVDDIQMKLVVPNSIYSNWYKSNAISDNMPLKFLTNFLQDVKQCGNDIEQGEEMLGEIVDEFGNLFDDSDDKPANIQGSPGYDNKRSGQKAKNSYTSQYTRVISPLGYGGVVW